MDRKKWSFTFYFADKHTQLEMTAHYTTHPMTLVEFRKVLKAQREKEKPICFGINTKGFKL